MPATAQRSIPIAALIALGSLAWIVVHPLRGRPLANPGLRAARATLLLLSLGRWATLIAPAAALPSAWPLLSFVGAALLWRATIWGSHQLTVVLVAPPARPSPAASLVPPSIAVTRPTPPAPPAPSPLELLLRAAPPGPPLRCASCGAAAPAREAVCPGCGLLFASRVPANLTSLAGSGYHPVRPLGAGGMSAVYLAYDRAAQEWCSLKTIVGVDSSGDIVWRRQAAASLAREASVLVELDHPQLSHIRDWLDDPLRPCLVLDLIAGVSLEQAIDERHGASLSASSVCAWGQTLAEVLRYLAAQESPVVHGDIKPANLLLAGASARPTLVDFGSAARLRPGGGAVQAHDAYGTPGYAAPEQYRGQIGAASDIYGLGATLYHLLTGDDPAQHPTQFPALAALPAELRELLAAMLSAEPQLRPPPAAVVARLATWRR